MESEEEKPRRPDTDLAWRVVVASLLLPIAWVVTGSVALTTLVGGFGALLLAQSHPSIAQISEEYPALRWMHLGAQGLVLLIFVAALLTHLSH